MHVLFDLDLVIAKLGHFIYTYIYMDVCMYIYIKHLFNIEFPFLKATDRGGDI